MTLLLLKIVVSIVVVLGLSWVAEHVNPRIAGIISGMPLGAVLILFFVGWEQGPEFATISALYAIPSITATVAFSLAYYYVSRFETRLSPLICSLAGLIVYLIAASGLNTITFTLVSASALTFVTVLVFAYLFRSQEANKVQSRPRMTLLRLLFRSGMAAAFVVAITTAADVVGPEWSGLLVGFPMTFLPFLLIIHISYSASHVRTIIRNFPLGLIGLAIFLISANQTIPLVGVNLAIVLSLGCALLYLSLLGLILNRMKPAVAQ